MALLKDLIVQGAARIIGDAYFATVKAGVWNGTPIDLSHGGTALTSGTQTAGKILKSTATNGVSEWVAQSTLSVGSATYAANVGASGIENTNYVTAATVIATCSWYSTMNAASDTDALINRWVEVRDFLNNFTEADTLASVLSTYVTLGTAQTITGAKTFANPISGDLLGNATTADRLKSTTAVGGAGTPVYFTGGLPVACTAANVRTFLGLGTVYSHAHTDYITGITYTPETRVLSWTKGGAANGSVTFGSNAFESYTLSGVSGRTIDASTAGYTAYYSAASTVSGTELLTFDTTNSIVTIKSTTYAALEIWRSNGNFSAIRYCNGETKTGLGYIGFPSNNTTSVAVGRPYWSDDASTKTYYQIVHSAISKTGNTINATGSNTQPVYIDANGQAQVCTAYSSASVSYATSSGQVRTQSGSTDATHYLTFVDSNNSSATAETVYTDAGITYNPSTNLLTVEKLTASGTVNLSGSTTIDSLTAGDLLVTGNTSLAGNVSLGTVSQGTWNGSVIDVAHGGTGLATLTSGSALIGNGTGAVTFKAIDTTPTNNSSNLITSGGVYTYITSTLGIASTISPNEVTPSLNSASWTNTGINLYTADQGSYMLQISDTTTAAIFTGVFSIYHGSSATANALDEIPLHMCANTASVNRIYAATLNGVLYVSSQDTEATQHHLTIKYKKII